MYIRGISCDSGAVSAQNRGRLFSRIPTAALGYNNVHAQGNSKCTVNNIRRKSTLLGKESSTSEKEDNSTQMGKSTFSVWIDKR